MKFILIMIIASDYNFRPPTSITQEFDSLQSCELARQAVVTSHGKLGTSVLVQGCFKK